MKVNWLVVLLIGIVVVVLLFILSPFVLAYLADSGSAQNNVSLPSTSSSTASSNSGTTTPPTSSVPGTATPVSTNVDTSTFNKINGIVVPLLAYPSGWIKTFAQVSPTYGNIQYISPVQQGTNPAAQIEITIKSASNNVAKFGTPEHDMNEQGVQNFTQSTVQISGVPAQEDEYDSVFTYGSETISSHYENIYFSLDGYDYTINAMYYKGNGDQYAGAIHTALNSATLSQ